MLIFLPLDVKVWTVLPWLFMVFWVSKGTLHYTFQSLCWMSLGFWWELHWICRFLLVVQPVLLCWLCQPMSMGDLSIFCSLPQSISSVVCSSPCRDHLHPLLNLFLSIWFCFEAIVNRIVFLYSFSICSLLICRNITDFCKLILYLATLLKLEVLG
jgi:hypothetical protein